LTPKAFAVLRYLVDHAGQLVTHHQLLDEVWPATQVQPQAVKREILNLRRALGGGQSRSATSYYYGHFFFQVFHQGNVLRKAHNTLELEHRMHWSNRATSFDRAQSRDTAEWAGQLKPSLQMSAFRAHG
jgi:DNA-binding winged helix-turn-helix (wHTH) protein